MIDSVTQQAARIQAAKLAFVIGKAQDQLRAIIGAARRAGVNVVASDGFVTSPLRFYKVLNKVEGIDFVGLEDMKLKPSVYVVVPSRGGGDILRAKDSQVVWRGAISGMTVIALSDR